MAEFVKGGRGEGKGVIQDWRNVLHNRTDEEHGARRLPVGSVRFVCTTTCGDDGRGRVVFSE